MYYTDMRVNKNSKLSPAFNVIILMYQRSWTNTIRRFHQLDTPSTKDMNQNGNLSVVFISLNQPHHTFGKRAIF